MPLHECTQGVFRGADVGGCASDVEPGRRRARLRERLVHSVTHDLAEIVGAEEYQVLGTNEPG
jgi:hypothetical protein